MRFFWQIPRQKFEDNSSGHSIAVAVRVAFSTVHLRLARFAAVELRWPLPVALTGQSLEVLLFAPLGGSKPGKRLKVEPAGLGVNHASCAALA